MTQIMQLIKIGRRLKYNFIQKQTTVVCMSISLVFRSIVFFQLLGSNVKHCWTRWMRSCCMVVVIGVKRLVACYVTFILLRFFILLMLFIWKKLTTWMTSLADWPGLFITQCRVFYSFIVNAHDNCKVLFCCWNMQRLQTFIFVKCIAF